jgi:dTDP-4-dehydrorhamnose 3,5-epimerase
MNFKGDIEGLELVVPQKIPDNRGWFQREYEGFTATQVASAFNTKAGTWRGLHYQVGASAQRKLIRCIRGAIFDIVVDLRHDSKTYTKVFGTTLSADNRYSLNVPRGFAHGYLTLDHSSEVLYLMEGAQDKAAERGIRWDDPTIKIWLPFEPNVISDKDKSWPDFRP